MNLKERHWRQLLTDIEGGQVIPVIGPELLIVEIEGENVPLYRYVARQIVERLELEDDSLTEHCSFDEAVAEFLLQQSRNPELKREELYYTIREIMEERPWTTPEPLRKLAGITHFDLYVSTTFDSEMQRAIDEVRFGGKKRTRSYAYCTKSEIVDLPNSFRPKDDPTVYSFFGKLNPVNDFSVTDDDILEFAHRLQSRDLRPHNLFDQFRNKHLLTLGCGFPGWLTRFFLAAAKGDELFTVGAPGVLADEYSQKDKALVGFLERQKTNVYTEGDAASFVEELHFRWTEKYAGEIGAGDAEEEGKGAGLPELKPDSVFISFHSGDRESAQQISAKFEEAGIDVWIDEDDLESGDHYRSKIESNIENCAFFMPLISARSVSGERRFFQLEWHKAIDEANWRPKGSPFIQPLILDETPPEDERIPKEFRECQVKWFKDLDAVIELTRRRIRDRRREGRPA